MYERSLLATGRMSGLLALAGVGLAMAGCAGAPVDLDDDHDEAVLAAHVEITPEVPRTLEDVEFAVHIEDEAGMHRMDMEDVLLEVRAPGRDMWSEIELAPMTDHYMGRRTFSESGEYTVRVLGRSHGGHDIEQLHTMTLHVERAHVDVHGFHIEYESNPGHIHAEEAATLQFWVSFEANGDPALGLTATIVVEESDGHVSTVEADEVEPGLYQGQFTFTDAGSSHVEIEFTHDDGDVVTADFHLDVSEDH